MCTTAKRRMAGGGLSFAPGAHGAGTRGLADCVAHCEHGGEPSTAAQIPEGLRVSNINSNWEGKGAGLGFVDSPTTVS